MLDYVSFPGLGLDQWFHLDKVAFTIFGRDVAWYGIFITIGMIFAFAYCVFRTRQSKILFDDVIDVTLFTVIFGVIGARLYYVLFTLDNYIVTTESSFWANALASLKKMVAVWNGGLAIPGGLIVGILMIILVCRHKKINFLLFLDCTAPGVMMAQAIGRWGNFFNVEAYGTETTLPWRMGIAQVASGNLILSETYVHPTFLYESLWNILGFVLINLFYKKKKFHGQIVLSYLSWYTLGRFFVECLRTDALMWGSVRITRLLCAIVFVLSVTVHVFLWILSGKLDKLSGSLFEIQPLPEDSASEENTAPAEGEDTAEDKKDNMASDTTETSQENENG